MLNSLQTQLRNLKQSKKYYNFLKKNKTYNVASHFDDDRISVQYFLFDFIYLRRHNDWQIVDPMALNLF